MREFEREEKGPNNAPEERCAGSIIFWSFCGRMEWSSTWKCRRENLRLCAT